MRKALNRERTNVGRTTYSERVKSILKSAKSDTVKEELAEQISIDILANNATKSPGLKSLK